MANFCKLLIIVVLVGTVFYVAYPFVARQKEVEKVEAAVQISGREMYASHCAVCHGLNGRGNGPAAAELKTLPADLTALAKTNNGQFPYGEVEAVLRNEIANPAHGTQTTPVWCAAFFDASSGGFSIVTSRIAELSRYLESIQSN